DARAPRVGCVKRTLRVESVRSASETPVWLRLYTDRAHNNRKAVRKTGKSVQSPGWRGAPGGCPVGLRKPVTTTLEG
ncbi:MAG: hypothetical protein L0387_27300, partial [Acidobacteria bacterium]|nr:hypothetical protein [Acidobacteriota bacterium]